MNLNWAFGLLICAVGNVLVPARRNEDDGVYECPEDGCHRTFLSANGRRRHFQRMHQASTHARTSCTHGCGKSYSVNSNNSLKLHERTCERNPNR